MNIHRMKQQKEENETIIYVTILVIFSLSIQLKSMSLIKLEELNKISSLLNAYILSMCIRAGQKC